MDKTERTSLERLIANVKPLTLEQIKTRQALSTERRRPHTPREPSQADRKRLGGY